MWAVTVDSAGSSCAVEPLRRHVPHGHAIHRAALGDVVVARGDLDELGRHRLAKVVVPHGPAGLGRRLGHEVAVGHRGHPVGDVEVERERRLVARVVVGRQEQVREVRLRGRRRSVGRVEERRRGVDLGIDGCRRRRVLGHHDAEPRALVDRLLGRDDDVLAVLDDGRRAAVHRDGAVARPRPVQVEARQRLGRLRIDRHGPRDRARRRGHRIAPRDVVVPDVIAAVAQRGVEAVTDPGGSRTRWLAARGGDARQCQGSNDGAGDDRGARSSEEHVRMLSCS